MTKPPDLAEIEARDRDAQRREGRGASKAQDYEQAAELRDQAEQTQEEGATSQQALAANERRRAPIGRRRRGGSSPRS
jgi:hypothetical protein